MVDCYKCVHRIVIPGNYHIGCNKPTSKPERRTWKGCGYYPINFDPNTIVSCVQGYSEDVNDRIPIPEDPLRDLFRMLLG